MIHHQRLPVFIHYFTIAKPLLKFRGVNIGLTVLIVLDTFLELCLDFRHFIRYTIDESCTFGRGDVGIGITHIGRRLGPDNPTFKPLVFPAKRVEIVGKVVNVYLPIKKKKSAYDKQRNLRLAWRHYCLFYAWLHIMGFKSARHRSCHCRSSKRSFSVVVFWNKEKMKRYDKRLGIYIASGNEKENRDFLRFIILFPITALIFLVGSVFILNLFLGKHDACRKNPQACFCDTLAQESNPAKRKELIQEIQKRGYSCVGIYYKESV